MEEDYDGSQGEIKHSGVGTSSAIESVGTKKCTVLKKRKAPTENQKKSRFGWFENLRFQDRPVDHHAARRSSADHRSRKLSGNNAFRPREAESGTSWSHCRLRHCHEGAPDPGPPLPPPLPPDITRSLMGSTLFLYVTLSRRFLLCLVRKIIAEVFLCAHLPNGGGQVFDNCHPCTELLLFF